MVEVQPESAKAQEKYGWELFQQAIELLEGEEQQRAFTEARQYLVRSLEIYPDFGDAHLNLSIVLDRQGDAEVDVRSSQ